MSDDLNERRLGKYIPEEARYETDEEYFNRKDGESSQKQMKEKKQNRFKP